MLCLLAIIIGASAGAGGRVVMLAAPLACIAAAVMNSLVIVNAFRSGAIRFGKRLRYVREERPVAFATLILMNAALALAYLFVFYVIVGIGS